MKKMVVLFSILITGTSLASNQISVSKEAQISSFTVTEVQMDQQYGPGGTDSGSGSGSTIELPMPPQNPPPTFDERVASAGYVISTARDLVALGQSVYELVQQGKPKNATEYAPVSIVPKEPTTKEYVDPFELETCSIPTQRKFLATVKNGFGKEVVRFEYMVIYSYNCSYNGAGKYIATAMIQPLGIKTNFGWDFTATMKLNGVMNLGTKASPIAGALLTMKYQMNSWSTSLERNDTILITGDGKLKIY